MDVQYVAEQADALLIVPIVKGQVGVPIVMGAGGRRINIQVIYLDAQHAMEQVVVHFVVVRVYVIVVVERESNKVRPDGQHRRQGLCMRPLFCGRT